jgi:nucleoside-diphosphate-sugar epimerase
MKILVTGASGYIGSNTCRALIRDGHELIGLLRENSSCALLDKYASETKVVRYQNYDELQNIVVQENVDAIVHLAANFSAADDYDSIGSLISDNITFATHLLHSAQKLNLKHFIYACSSWQFNDNFEKKSHNLYAASKNAFSSILEYFANTQNLNIINLVLFDVYGPLDPRKKLFSSLARFADEKRVIELSPGEQVLDLIHIDDVSNAVVSAISYAEKQPAILNKNFAVRTGLEHSLRDYLTYFNAISGNQIEFKFGAKDYRENEVMRPPNLTDYLPNWKAQITFEDGLEQIWLAHVQSRKTTADKM